MRNCYHGGEISALFQVPVETLRYYDKEGLIRLEQMEENGYRLYGSTQLERICTVLSLRATGVPKAALPNAMPSDMPIAKPMDMNVPVYVPSATSLW